MEDDQSHAASSVLQDLVGTSCWPSILLKANMPLGNRAGEKHEQHEKRSKTSKLQPFWHRHHQTWLVLDEFNHFQSFLDIFLDYVRMMFGCFHCVSAMKWDYFWCTTFSNIFKFLICFKPSHNFSVFFNRQYLTSHNFSILPYGSTMDPYLLTCSFWQLDRGTCIAESPVTGAARSRPCPGATTPMGDGFATFFSWVYQVYHMSFF